MGKGIIVKVIGAIDGELFFIACFVAVFASFAVCLFVSVFKSEYGVKRRAWFLIVVAFFCAMLRLRAEMLGNTDYSPLLMIFGLMLSLPLYFIREKVKAKTDEKGAREFVRFIDGKIHAGDSFVGKSADKWSKAETLNVLPREESKGADLDFSHVKSVLERLDPATLSYSDRKQVHDLEASLYAAEKGEIHEDTKAKINEGLGNLLKIMAKHGV